MAFRTMGMALLVAGCFAAAPMAQAKGCLKGAVVGGAAGHVAGRHGVLGAAAGCAVGHHRATKKDQDLQRQQQAQQGGTAQQVPADQGRRATANSDQR